MKTETIDLEKKFLEAVKFLENEFNLELVGTKIDSGYEGQILFNFNVPDCTQILEKFDEEEEEDVEVETIMGRISYNEDTMEIQEFQIAFMFDDYINDSCHNRVEFTYGQDSWVSFSKQC